VREDRAAAVDPLIAGLARDHRAGGERADSRRPPILRRAGTDSRRGWTMSRETEMVEAHLASLNQTMGHVTWDARGMVPPAGFDIRAAYEGLHAMRACVMWLLSAVQQLERQSVTATDGSLRRPTR
jgi:hypothetical protein